MRLAAVAGFLVALLFIAYGLWLVVTPDYDGGRRPVGTLVLGLAVPLLVGSIWALNGQRRDSRH
jgi:MFS-type transporter involved in bile tolerance (Atg22 family)